MSWLQSLEVLGCCGGVTCIASQWPCPCSLLPSFHIYADMTPETFLVFGNTLPMGGKHWQQTQFHSSNSTSHPPGRAIFLLFRTDIQIMSIFDFHILKQSNTVVSYFFWYIKNTENHDTHMLTHAIHTSQCE